MSDDSKTIEALQARVAELEAEQSESRDRVRMLEFLLDQMPQFISYISADRHFVFNNAKSLSGLMAITERPREG